MKTTTCIKPYFLVLAFLAAPVISFAETNGLDAVWHFDEGSGHATTKAVSGKQDPFVVYLKFDQGGVTDLRLSLIHI